MMISVLAYANKAAIFYSSRLPAHLAPAKEEETHDN